MEGAKFTSNALWQAIKGRSHIRPDALGRDRAFGSLKTAAEMESHPYGVLRGKLEKIKRSNIPPEWLAEELVAANVVGEEDRIAARDRAVPKAERREELLEAVMGNGAEGVFQTFVNILRKKSHLAWLVAELESTC